MDIARELDKLNAVHSKYNTKETNANYNQWMNSYGNYYSNIGFGVTFEQIRDNRDFNSILEGRSNKRQERLKDIDDYLKMPFNRAKTNDNPYYDNSLMIGYNASNPKNEQQNQQSNEDPTRTTLYNNIDVGDYSQENSGNESSSNFDKKSKKTPETIQELHKHHEIAGTQGNGDIDDFDIDPEEQIKQMKKKMQEKYIVDLRSQMEYNKKLESDKREAEILEHQKYEEKHRQEFEKQEAEKAPQGHQYEKDLINQKDKLEKIFDGSEMIDKENQIQENYHYKDNHREEFISEAQNLLGEHCSKRQAMNNELSQLKNDLHQNILQLNDNNRYIRVRSFCYKKIRNKGMILIFTSTKSKRKMTNRVNYYNNKSSY